jgi:hypothetical protein
MGLNHLPNRCPRTDQFRFHRLSPVYWTSWRLQPRALRSGSSPRRNSRSLCPFFHRWSAGPNHNPTTFLASWRSVVRSERFVCVLALSFLLFSFIQHFLGQSPNSSAKPDAVVCFCSGIVVNPPRLPSLRPHQLGSSTTLTSRLTCNQGPMGYRTSSSHPVTIDFPSPLIQSALTLSCTQPPGDFSQHSFRIVFL